MRHEMAFDVLDVKMAVRVRAPRLGDGIVEIVGFNRTFGPRSDIELSSLISGAIDREVRASAERR